MEQDHGIVAQQAILRERTHQNYQVVVALPERKETLLGYPIPAGIEIYQTITTCTVQHETGIPCMWIDFAFIREDGAICVILESEIEASGIPYDECIRALVGHFERMAGAPAIPHCQYQMASHPCGARATMHFRLPGENGDGSQDLYLCDRHTGKLIADLFPDMHREGRERRNGGPA